MILLEGMSGKGSEIGRNFDEIAQIIRASATIKIWGSVSIPVIFILRVMTS